MTADRDATVDVVGDAEQVLSMAARAGPNGATATTTTDGLLAIDVTGGNANVGPLGRIFGGQGGGGAQVTWFDRVSTFRTTARRRRSSGSMTVPTP